MVHIAMGFWDVGLVSAMASYLEHFFAAVVPAVVAAVVAVMIVQDLLDNVIVLRRAKSNEIQRGRKQRHTCGTQQLPTHRLL